MRRPASDLPANNERSSSIGRAGAEAPAHRLPAVGVSSDPDHLKGIGPIWQLTAVDTNTRWAFCEFVVGHVSAKVAAMFLHTLAKQTWKALQDGPVEALDHGVVVRGLRRGSVMDELELRRGLGEVPSDELRPVCR